MNYWTVLRDEWFAGWRVSAPDEPALADAIRRASVEHRIQRVCWHGPAGIAEGEVTDLGALLRTLRPDVDPALGHYMASEPPVVIFRGARAIRIELATDIWFPFVAGLLEAASPRMYDNAELAARHTPRLNAFLRDVRAAAERAGGTWALADPENYGTRYAEMTHVGGIEL